MYNKINPSARYSEMTIREYMSLRILEGMLSAGEPKYVEQGTERAKRAVRMADKLIKELNNG
jgi:hypothetical protein